MKRLLIALLFCAASVSAQETIAPRIAVMDDYVRAILIRDWDIHANDSVVLERGYCLGWQLDFWGGEIVWRVTEISAPDSVDAGLNGINFSCKGKYPGHLSELHVHPATSCLSQDGPCFPGGVYAYQCLPSPPDERYLLVLGQPFAMIQCSREAVIFHLPKPQAASAPLPNMRSGSIVKVRRSSPFPTGAIRYRQIS